MPPNPSQPERRLSLMGRFVLFRLIVTSAAIVLLLAGAVFLAPRMEAVYKDMKVELPGLSVMVFGAARAARSAPWASLMGAAGALVAVVSLPLILPRPLNYLLTIVLFVGLFAAVAVVAAAIFWPYLTMLQSLTDGRGTEVR